MSELKVIYLGPACQEQGDGREWCQDDVWQPCECGHTSVKFVASTELDRVTSERDALQLRLNAADQRIDELTAAPVVERQDVLPCDVRVAPATTIRKGCKVETLMQCIELRKGQSEKFTRFSAAPPAPVSAAQHPFADKVIRKLQRFQECADDGQSADIGRHWFDLLTQLGLLNRVQRSPALWEITQQGEDCLDKVKS